MYYNICFHRSKDLQSHFRRDFEVAPVRHKAVEKVAMVVKVN